MTSVAYIHGPNRPPQDEWAQRAANARAPQVRWRPIGTNTIGGNRLILAADQMQLLSSFYPDNQQLRTDYQALVDALEQGINTTIKLPAGTSPYIKALIQEAKALLKPERAGVGALIPYDDCEALMTVSYDPYDQTQSPILSDNPGSLVCKERNAEIGILNRYLEPGAPHLLYNFVANPNAATPVVSTKSVLQKNAADAISTQFNFDRRNLNMWLRNGVMRSNAAQNIPPVSPEQSIETMRKAGEASVGLDPATIALVVGILKAIVAAIGATSALLAAIKAAKRARIEAVAVGISSPSFGPEENDWRGAGTQPGNTNGTNLQKLLPYGLLAAAGVVLLSE